MFRIGIIEGSDNPEQSRSSETEKKPDVPSESDNTMICKVFMHLTVHTVK